MPAQRRLGSQEPLTKGYQEGEAEALSLPQTFCLALWPQHAGASTRVPKSLMRCLVLQEGDGEQPSSPTVPGSFMANS